jgi:hypothetical protein
LKALKLIDEAQQGLKALHFTDDDDGDGWNWTEISIKFCLFQQQIKSNKMHNSF